MNYQKPSQPKGTRDFSPVEMNRRNYIFRIIKETFELYGYQPIETPAMENLTTLLGKYGEEGDKLIFRILNSGDFISGIDPSELLNSSSQKISGKISEKGLRYDLTVPFARYVVQHRNEITFPFKRYQLQPVWRADRPQKGRYREFYQCDADVIGSDSLINDAELLVMADQIFRKLNIGVAIKLNSRKILTGIAEIIGHPDKIIDITVSIDKLDKIGIDKVNEELAERGLDQSAISKLQPIINLSGSNEQKLDRLKELLTSSEIGKAGIEETAEVLKFAEQMGIVDKPELDLTLARGLNYYTGTIIEVKATEAGIGSLSGGGRYDNLTGIFGLPGVSGTGISFGADRIYDIMNEKNLFPEHTSGATHVLLINFGGNESIACLKLASFLREHNINTEFYPEDAKIKKQFAYADNKQIPWVVIIGENELATNTMQLKNMHTGEQKTADQQLLLQIITE
ncbi:MAG TPA: histidine--tRNA ligase [Lentimicrobium sp.]|nr:histidine--tRNA ligase [Lentimicrobium sp.]